MRRVLAGALWLALLLGGTAAVLYGIVTAFFSSWGTDTEMFGYTIPVHPVVPAAIIILVGIVSLTAAWLLDQRWSPKPGAKRP
jgi:hypothetical protein